MPGKRWAGRLVGSPGNAAPAVQWVTFVFAGLMAIQRGFLLERENGAWYGLLLCPVDRGAIFVAKMASNVIVLGLAQLVLMVLLTVLLGASDVGGGSSQVNASGSIAGRQPRSGRSAMAWAVPSFTLGEPAHGSGGRTVVEPPVGGRPNAATRRSGARPFRPHEPMVGSSGFRRIGCGPEPGRPVLAQGGRRSRTRTARREPGLSSRCRVVAPGQAPSGAGPTGRPCAQRMTGPIGVSPRVVGFEQVT